jgi:hypothetical protein
MILDNHINKTGMIIISAIKDGNTSGPKVTPILN